MNPSGWLIRLSNNLPHGNTIVGFLFKGVIGILWLNSFQDALVPPKSIDFDSLVTFQNSQGVSARGTLSHATRNQVIFETYNPYSIVQLSEVLTDLRLLRGERLLYSGRAVVSNIVVTGLMAIVSATLVDPWSDLSRVGPGTGLREEVEQFVRDFDATHEIRPLYQLSVTNLGSFLAELNRWLSQVEATSDSPVAPKDQRDFTLEIEHGLAVKLGGLFGIFEKQAKEINEEEAINHKSFARRQLHPLMLVSPFIFRTFTKPLGYAGDYEMVNMIVRDPLEGSTTYAKILNSLILRSDGAQAHRNRIDRLQRYLHDEALRVTPKRPLRVLNIGCGPAHELQRFIRNDPLSDQCEFHLMDFNDETLGYAKNKLKEAAAGAGRSPKLVFHHKSINELLKEATRSSLGRDLSPFVAADLIYCAGLFDYLNDKICNRLLELFYAWVNDGGFVVATNVTPQNSVRYFLEHILEWNLIYRGMDEMSLLAPDRGKREVNCDETGVNVFLEIRKTPEATRL